MSRLSVEYDPMMKVTTEYFADGEGGLIIRETQDVEDIYALNNAQHATVDERARWTPRNDTAHLGAHVARVPMILLMEWQKEWRRKELNKAEQDKDLLRKLDDHDNRMFRTRPGRLSR